MSVQFDGSTSYLIRDAVTVLDYNSNYTILGKVYADQVTVYEVLSLIGHAVGGSDDDAIVIAHTSARLGGEEQLAGVYSTNDGTSVIATATWYHVALVRSGNNLLIYLDGTLETTVTGGNHASRPASDRMVLGAWLTASDKFTGRLFHWAAWQSALTQTEVNTEKTSWPPAKASPWAYWPLSVHTDLTDGSGNARHWTGNGTLSTAGDPPGGGGGGSGTALDSDYLLIQIVQR